MATEEGGIHMRISTIGLDLAKHVFQVHGVDEGGMAVIRKRLGRAEVLRFFASIDPCLVGMEACATAHHWARELMKLGHSVKLMPPAYVKPYVRRGKNDAADAAAICEAVARPNMRFVPVKRADQQAVLVLHRARALLVRQRTMLANALRAHLAEFGIIVAQGIGRIGPLIERIFAQEEDPSDVPPLARAALEPLAIQFLQLQPRIKSLEAELLAWHKTNEESRRLETIPGVGFLSATAIAATVTDAAHFRSGREFAAWLGLTPRQNSSGGKERLGRVSKMGDGYLRSLLFAGATAVIRFARPRASVRSAWLNRLLANKPAKVAAVALANKMARIAWVVLARKEKYRAPALVA
jgi:transposase